MTVYQGNPIGPTFRYSGGAHFSDLWPHREKALLDWWKCFFLQR